MCQPRVKLDYRDLSEKIIVVSVKKALNNLNKQRRLSLITYRDHVVSTYLAGEKSLLQSGFLTRTLLELELLFGEITTIGEA